MRLVDEPIDMVRTIAFRGPVRLKVDLHRPAPLATSRAPARVA
jgi:hypothetical protein